MPSASLVLEPQAPTSLGDGVGMLCDVCGQKAESNIVQCSGVCGGIYHLKCLSEKQAARFQAFRVKGRPWRCDRCDEANVFGDRSNGSFRFAVPRDADWHMLAARPAEQDGGAAPCASAEDIIRARTQLRPTGGLRYDRPVLRP